MYVSRDNIVNSIAIVFYSLNKNNNCARFIPKVRATAWILAIYEIKVIGKVKIIGKVGVIGN